MRRALVGLLVTGLLAGCGSSPAPEERGSLSGTSLGNPFTVPGTVLTDTEGRPYDLAADSTRPLTLLFFGYTHCPDICQLVMSTVASALTRLVEADRDRVEVLFVTTDPARDDATALRGYLDRFDPAFTGLTGDLEAIVDAGRELGVHIDRGSRLPTGGYDVAHTDHLFVIDAADEVPVIWQRDVSSAQLAADLLTLLERS